MCCILNGQPTKAYCIHMHIYILHGAPLSVMRQSGWEGDLGEDGYMYMCG